MPAGQLIIMPEARSQMETFRQQKQHDPEAGGILLGRQFVHRSDIIVDEVTTPLKNDKRSRYRFHRSADHQRVAVNKWKKSDGYCMYLGLWHTHPQAHPTPSSIDYADWMNALNKGKYEGDHLFFIILGTKSIGCWMGSKESKYKKSAEQITFIPLNISG